MQGAEHGLARLASAWDRQERVGNGAGNGVGRGTRSANWLIDPWEGAVTGAADPSRSAVESDHAWARSLEGSRQAGGVGARRMREWRKMQNGCRVRCQSSVPARSSRRFTTF
jgi:hypothetical protein